MFALYTRKFLFIPLFEPTRKLWDIFLICSWGCYIRPRRLRLIYTQTIVELASFRTEISCPLQAQSGKLCFILRTLQEKIKKNTGHPPAWSREYADFILRTRNLFKVGFFVTLCVANSTNRCFSRELTWFMTPKGDSVPLKKSLYYALVQTFCFITIDDYVLTFECIQGELFSNFSEEFSKSSTATS